MSSTSAPETPGEKETGRLESLQRWRLLHRHDSTSEVKRQLRNCYLVGLPLYLLATAVAPFVPWLTLAICSGLWIFWSVAGVER